MDDNKPEVLLKIAVMGDIGVGKTSLIKRIVHRMFSHHYTSTQGVDFALKVYPLVERVVRCQFWDIAGAERFGSTMHMRRYLKETDAVILMWDATRPATFDPLSQYFPFIEKEIPIIFVRSKNDLNKEKQDDFDARKKTIAEWTAKRGMAPEDVVIIDTSSKDGFGIEDFEKAMLDFAPRLQQKQDEKKAQSVSRKLLPPEPRSPAAPVVPPTPFFLVERIEKMKHSRKPRNAELEIYFAKEKPTTKDIEWLLMHLDSVAKDCSTANNIRNYLKRFKIDIDHRLRPTEGPVVELLKLLDEEERAKPPKIVTLVFFANFSDQYVAERDVERKFILDVAKNIYLRKAPYENLNPNNAPKSVRDILAKPANRIMPEGM